MEEILAYITVGLLVSTPLSHGLLLAAEKFHAYAMTTPTEKDDAVASTALLWAEKIAKGLGFLGRILPVITRGGKVEKNL